MADFLTPEQAFHQVAAAITPRDAASIRGRVMAVKGRDLREIVGRLVAHYASEEVQERLRHARDLVVKIAELEARHAELEKRRAEVDAARERARDQLAAARQELEGLRERLQERIQLLAAALPDLEKRAQAARGQADLNRERARKLQERTGPLEAEVLPLLQRLDREPGLHRVIELEEQRRVLEEEVYRLQCALDFFSFEQVPPGETDLEPITRDAEAAVSLADAFTDQPAGAPEGEEGEVEQVEGSEEEEKEGEAGQERVTDPKEPCPADDDPERRARAAAARQFARTFMETGDLAAGGPSRYAELLQKMSDGEAGSDVVMDLIRLGRELNLVLEAHAILQASVQAGPQTE